MIIIGLFNDYASLQITRASNGDVWMKTLGDEDGQFKLGGSVRLRTGAGGGHQDDSLDAMYQLLRDDNWQHNYQLSLAHSVAMKAPNINSAEKRYVTCDDERGNYAELFRFQNGLHGIRTVDEGKQWVGPVVWIKPGGNLPMTYEQQVFGGLFKSAFSKRPAYNFGTSS